jgi:death-on-curing family protein
MAQRVIAVSQLARSAGIDTDEALIALWDAGLEAYRGPGDRIRRRDMDAAQHAVGIPTRNDLTDLNYWVRRLGLDSESDLRALLQLLGTPMPPRARSLPKGSVAKLKRHVLLEHHATLPPANAPEPEETIEERLVWRAIGHKGELRLLAVAEVLGIHWELVRDFGEHEDRIDPPGVRSEDLLESAVFRQHTGLGAEKKHPTVEMAAAALTHSLVHDHPFHNGNKRTAIVSMLVLLDENGLAATCSDEELFEFVIRLAQHKLVTGRSQLADREVLATAEWICAHTRTVEKGDHPIHWRRFRQILMSYGCELTLAAGVGNRMNISRMLPVRGRFGRIRARTLQIQVRYADDGRDAAINAIKAVRSRLELDEEHGVDSHDFYGRGGLSAAEFITTYRKTLKRLARL